MKLFKITLSSTYNQNKSAITRKIKIKIKLSTKLLYIYTN